MTMLATVEHAAPISAIFAGSIAHNQPQVCAEPALRHFTAKEHIFFEGDERNHVYEVVEGIVCLYSVMADGRRQVISFCHPGSLLGLCPGSRHQFNAEALSGATVRSYSASGLEKIAAKRPDLAQALLSLTMDELTATRDQLLTLGRKSAPEKMASFLLELSRRNRMIGADAYTLELPMSRSDIADYLGLTIETVSRNFTKFKTAGLIELNQSSTVMIRDMEGLEEIASCDEEWD